VRDFHNREAVSNNSGSFILLRLRPREALSGLNSAERNWGRCTNSGHTPVDGLHSAENRRVRKV